MSDQYAPLPGKIPGTEVEMGGRKFVVPPLNLDGIQEIEPYLDKIGSKDLKVREQLANAIPIIWTALRRQYPEMTKEDVSALVDLGNFHYVLAAVVSVSGFKEAPSGEPSPASP